MRAALGASRGRMLRQTITEGVLLSTTGGALGVWLAYGGVEALIRTFPTSVPLTSDIAVDLPVLLFALAVSMATGVLFGLVYVVPSRLHGNLEALKQGGNQGASSGGRHYLHRALVTSEVALAVILVIGAGLLIRTVLNLTKVDAGFDPSRLVTFAITLPMATSEPDTRARAHQRVLDKLRTTTGVEGATAMSGLPPNRSLDAVAAHIANHMASDGTAVELIDYCQFVMDDYFETLGIPIVTGRSFERTDIESEAKLVVVNETLAKKIWKEHNPIGERLRPNLGTIGTSNSPWHTVIGVAKDVKQRSIEQSAGTEVYVFLNQHGIAPPTMNVVLRTTLSPAALSGTIERRVREVDPGVPIVRLRDMESVFEESIGRPRLLAQLLGAFSGLALTLAAIGIYGVLSYSVVQRRAEISIRLALGADRSHVLAQVIKQGLLPAAIGLFIGLGGALGLTRLMESLLFGVGPHDFATLVSVAAMIALIAAAASWLPAWRASRLDPAALLRNE